MLSAHDKSRLYVGLTGGVKTEATRRLCLAVAVRAPSKRALFPQGLPLRLSCVIIIALRQLRRERFQNPTSP